MRLALLFLLALGCGGAPSLMGYHRHALDDLARGHLDCPLSELTFEDTTPDDLPRVANDPETRRYTVSGCGRSAAFLCFTHRMANASPTPECRPLRQEGEGRMGGVYVGPLRVGGSDE